MARPEPWTLRRTVTWMAEDLARRGVDSPRLDAELIAAHALGIDRLRLYMDLDRPLDDEERAAIRVLLRRRRAREPMAYILGYRDFYGRRFEVTPDVLIPRPETEELVEHALRRLPERASVSALDVGTGSGAIALTLAAERPGLRVTATDRSPAALRVARRNASRLGVQERVRWFVGDLFSPLPEDEAYDLVVSNPPYVAEPLLPTLQPEVARWEPREALIAGPDGMDVLRRLVAEAPARIRPGGWLLLEMGAEQGEAVATMLHAAGFREVSVHRDLAGRDRIARGRIPLA